MAIKWYCEEKATCNYINLYIKTDPNSSNIVIFTDSLSTLQALGSGTDVTKDFTHLVWALHNIISRHHVKEVLQWIPSHTGIPGNERADELAKRGASLPQIETPVTYSTCCQMIRSNLKENWLNQWAIGKTGRCMYGHMTRPQPRDPINNLTRTDQSLIFY